MCRYCYRWFAMTAEGFLNVSVKLLVLYSWISHWTMLTGYKVLIQCYPWSWPTELIVGDRKQVKLLLLWCYLKPEICNEEDIDIIVFMLVWTKEKFYLNIQTYYKIIRRSLYYYCSSYAAQSASLQFIAPYTGCALLSFIVIGWTCLIIYDDLTKHAAAYDNYLYIKTTPRTWGFPGDVFMLIQTFRKSM